MLPERVGDNGELFICGWWYLHIFLVKTPPHGGEAASRAQG